MGGQAGAEGRGHAPTPAHHSHWLLGGGEEQKVLPAGRSSYGWLRVSKTNLIINIFFVLQP